MPTLTPVFLETAAKNPVTYTPAQAREKFGFARPVDQYNAIVAKRELGQGPTPYAKNHHDALPAFTKSA